ncbi:unnamed protein product [Bemisia tabaci]|uniref:Glycine N-acyltransferase-like protein n=2 Tax=Bemisia tabaci TaxID=7038 RepID=A0A9P0F509_BEMTA|nr:unnamed protein product [Bemisia tabaci]
MYQIRSQCMEWYKQLYYGDKPKYPIGLAYTTSDRFEGAAIVGIFKISDSHDYRVTVYCFGEDTSMLQEALLRTNRIKWNSPESTIFFTAIPEKLLPVVQRCVSGQGFGIVQTENIVYQWKTPDHLNSLNYSCPPEVRVAPLGLEHVELIRKNWSNLPASAEYIETLIKHNINLGVYSRATGELCAWVLCNEFCALTMMHTMENHRRKGYAQLLCNAMSERLLRAGIIARAVVMEENRPSLKLFESHKFRSSRDFFIYVLAMPRRAVDSGQWEI